MFLLTDEQRSMAISLVRTFCAKPYREHGAKRTSGAYKGWHRHDGVISFSAFTVPITIYRSTFLMQRLQPGSFGRNSLTASIGMNG
jgi:hypothetical protein